MPVETRYEHIVLNDAGVPAIAGTTMKVIELVTAHLAYGWSAEELHFQFPYLSLGKIHSALAYYWDHQADLDREIQDGRDKVKAMREALGDSPLVIRLRAQGLI